MNTLGLRLHNTLGDGNCLFRALSDQLYGTEVYHLTLRADITAWMAKYAERYEGFVEDDRSFEDHLRCMREPGQFAFLVDLTSYGMIRPSATRRVHVSINSLKPPLGSFN